MGRIFSMHIEDDKVQNFFMRKSEENIYIYIYYSKNTAIILKLILPVVYDDAK
jgi:hypothetical protein